MQYWAVLYNTVLRPLIKLSSSEDAEYKVNVPPPVHLASYTVPSDTHTLSQAALLHDTVEDTGTHPEELEKVFGPEVKALVAEVSDDKTLPKQERKRLQVGTH